MENTTQITFKDFLTVLKKNVIFIIAAALLLGSIFAVGAQLLIKNKYSCSLTCVMGESIMTSTEYSQLGRNLEVAKLTLKTPEVMTKVVSRADVVAIRSDGTQQPAVSEMTAATSISTNRDRGSYTVTVTTEDPQVSYRMICAYRDLMPEIIEENRLYAARVLVSSSKAPTSPSNRSRAVKYGLVGAAIGAVLVYGICLIKKFTDVKIYDAEDVMEVTDIPIIGNIPVYAGDGSSHSRS